MTTIRDLPVYGLDLTARTNEDFVLVLPYTDDRLAAVVVYRGGLGIAPPGFAGSTPYTGTLPANFALPASGGGHPGLGVAAIAGGVLTGVSIVDPGRGYGRSEVVGLSIPGAGPDVVAAVAVGNPLALDGLTMDVEVRPNAGSKLVLLSASTGPTIGGLPTNGTVSLRGNVMVAGWPEAAARTLAPGSYAIEVRAYAEGVTRVIATGVLAIVQGVAHERG